LQGKVLTIAVANSAWMQEMTYLKPALIEQFGEAVGENVVKEIRLVLSPTTATRQEREPKKEAPPVHKEAALPADIVAATEAVQDQALRKSVEKALKAHWPKAEKK
jgi:hypothetical protein